MLILQKKIKELDIIIQITGHPETHPLKGLEPFDISIEYKQKIHGLISRLINLLPAVAGGRSFFSGNLGLLVPDNWTGIKWMGQMSNRLISTTYLNKALLELANKTDLMEELQEVISSGHERDRLHSELCQSFSPEIMDGNVFLLQQEWKAIEMKWFLPKYFAKRSFLKNEAL
ncbi:MAG: hypothetical protein LUH63_05870 [Parabacteroides sp.]|nr:hypothetical protein [Parabacteroides sp.]